MLIFTISFSLTPAHEQELSKPEALFAELWETFSDRYAFFELRGVNWEAQRRKYRPLVNADTTDEQLFDILCNMLKPLNDGHVNLKAKGIKKRRFNAETEARFYQEFSSTRN